MTTDGRRDPRKPTALEIRFKSATLNDFVEKHSRDISRGGMFVKMRTPLPSGTLIKFDIRLKDEESLIQGVGRVVWRREEDAGEEAPAGMGIKFIKLDPTSRSNLETIIEGKPEGKGVAGDAPIVAPQTTEPAALPKPIAPVRPQAVPKSAKRTMIGMGSIPPKADRQPGEDGADEERKEAEDAAAAPEAAAPAVAESPVPSPADVAPAVPAPAAVVEDVPPAPVAAEAGTGDFLADISSAIDSALSGGRDSSLAQPQAPEIPAAPEAKPKGEAIAATPEAVAPAPVPVQQEAAEKLGAQSVLGEIAGAEVPKKVLSAPPTAVSTRAGVEPRRGGVPAAVWVVIAAVVGVLVWYFALRQPAGEESGAQTSGGAAVSGAGQGTGSGPAVSEPSTGPTDTATAAEPGQPQPAPAQPAVIEVKSTPPGATVFVNGDRQEGLTPLVLDKVEAGKEVEIRASLFGFGSQSEKVVPSVKPLAVELTLPPAKIKVAFGSDPEGATIMVDGKRWGKTPTEVTKAGVGPRIAYVLEKADYNSFEGTVGETDWTEADGVFTARVQVTLAKSEPTPEPVKPAPAVVAPKPEAPKVEKPKAEPPKAEPPKAEPPKAEKPKEEKPKEEKPKAEAPKAEKPKAEKPKEQPAEKAGGAIEENPF